MLWAYVLRSRKSSAPMARRKGGPPPSGVSPVTCARAPVRLAAAAPSTAPEALFKSDLRLRALGFSVSDFFMDSLPGWIARKRFIVSQPHGGFKRARKNSSEPLTDVRGSVAEPRPRGS